MPKYIADKITYSDEKEMESLTNMEIIKRNYELATKSNVTKSQYVDKKSIKTTKASAMKKFNLPPVKESRNRSPPTTRNEKQSMIDEQRQETLSEIYAQTMQMGVVGGDIRSRHKSVDINAVPSSYKRQPGAFKVAPIQAST